MTDEEIKKIEFKYIRRASLQACGLGEIDDDVVEIINLINEHKHLLEYIKTKENRIGKTNEYVNEIKDDIKQDYYDNLIFYLNDYIGE